MNTLKKNDLYTVTIDGYGSEAQGVCHIDGRAVFVPRALPGENWEIRILKVTNSAVYARGEKLLLPSPERRDSECPWFGICGGCDCWHMSYEEELSFKLLRVNDALRHIGRQSLEAERIIGSDSIYRYRNKGIFAFAPSENGVRYGFYRERSHQLISLDRCLIQSELTERCAAAVAGFVNAKGIPAYSEETGRGTVRHVFCRRAVNTGDAIACIVAARGFGGCTQELVEALRQACPELTGIVLNINKTRGNTVLSGNFYTLWGRADMEDILCSLRFSISPQAFYQINPPQAQRLYELAMEYACPERVGLAFDLYCGAGTISLCLARRADRVIGAEIVPEAVENAAANSAANGITNTEFICGDAGQAAQELARRGLRPEVVVVDPPRKGMDEKAVDVVASMAPERIVYVSCGPATLARDILRFNSFGYELRSATAVDMFPRTCHVETVVLLSKLKVDHHIEIEIKMDELDLTAAESKATYDEIKAYVLDKYGLKVSQLYIAQVKRKCGIIERKNYNVSKKEDAKVPQCPPEKEAAIMDALKHFQMI